MVFTKIGLYCIQVAFPSIVGRVQLLLGWEANPDRYPSLTVDHWLTPLLVWLKQQSVNLWLPAKPTSCSFHLWCKNGSPSTLLAPKPWVPDINAVQLRDTMDFDLGIDLVLVTPEITPRLWRNKTAWIGWMFMVRDVWWKFCVVNWLIRRRLQNVAAKLLALGSKGSKLWGSWVPLHTDLYSTSQSFQPCDKSMTSWVLGMPPMPLKVTWIVLPKVWKSIIANLSDLWHDRSIVSIVILYNIIDYCTIVTANDWTRPLGVHLGCSEGQAVHGKGPEGGRVETQQHMVTAFLQQFGVDAYQPEAK